ncbi:MAG: hypothetical protein NTW86_12785 [Candidatus Sumerlaeota bacterium]|nr:hypothetical protein [Candidatus Sumerlaeota bacterium]
MSQVLAGFHKDWIFHEQPGVKHWWSIKGNSGAACVDWPPMFDFFARHRLPAPEEIREVDFTTASPGVSARCRWLTIEDQIRRNALSSASIRRNPVARRLDGTTSNVACLALDLAPLAPGEPVAARLDEQDLEIPWPDTGSRVWLARASGQWAVAPRPSPAMKGPHRYGPFKQAFNERFLFVYGTKGSPEENEWALGKARYDAETFWVQGNGSVDVVADTAFDPSREPDRGVILYGNSQTNAAWSALLGDSPVQVGSRSVRIGEREIEGDDVGCLFLRPRPHTDRACVGVVAGTGLKGMRLTDSLPYFAAGVEYPDCVAFDSSVLARGVEGVRAAGFFGGDWGVDSGEFAFSE